MGIGIAYLFKYKSVFSVDVVKFTTFIVISLVVSSALLIPLVLYVILNHAQYAGSLGLIAIPSTILLVVAGFLGKETLSIQRSLTRPIKSSAI